MIKKNNESKAVQKQVLLEAQKEEQRQERLREEEKKLIEEKKRLEEQKNLDKKLKHEEAVKGIGESQRIPVLMYHSIDYEKGNELRIPKEKFREQMKYLKDNDFNTLSLEELYSHIVFGSKIPDKPIVLTFDDGYVDNYINAYPVLREFGFKAAIFAITNTIDVPGAYLNSSQIKELDANGISVESHTVSHPKLDKLSYEKQVEELKESKEALEKILGREVKYFAYPYGLFNNDTLKAVQELGYKMAVSMKSGLTEKKNGVYVLNRFYVSNNDNLEKFKSYVNIK